MEIKIGDSVVKKGTSGPSMAVYDMGSNGDKAYCRWRDKSGELKNDVFDTDDLEIKHIEASRLDPAGVPKKTKIT